MHPSTAKRVRESYATMSADLPAFVDRCYELLFKNRPDLRAMFPADIEGLKGHFGAAIALIARNVERLDDLAISLSGLGRQHSRLGVRSEHYELLRTVMLDALAQTLGSRWTPKTSAAWTEVLERVCALMQVENAGEWHISRAS